MGKLLRSLALLICLVFVTSGQNPPKTLIADGSKYFSSANMYGGEVEDVFKKIRNYAVRSAGFPEPVAGYTYIKSPVVGNFYEKGSPAKAYLYSLCDKDANCPAQGVIVIAEDVNTHKSRVLINVTYKYRSDVQTLKIPDLNGNGIDELGLIEQVDDNNTIRVIEFVGNSLRSLGLRRIYGLNSEPPFRAKLFLVRASNGAATFFEERETITGKGWTQFPASEVTLEPDPDRYITKRSGTSVLKQVVFGTFVIQMIAFIGLFVLVLYEVLSSGSKSKDDTVAEPKKDTKAQNGTKSDLATGDNLPTLDPINCDACGASVPLKEDEMTCPNCGVKTAAPADYFDVVRAREAINSKIRESAAYLRRAKLLTSSWMRIGLAAIVVWIAYSITAVFVFSSRESFEPFQDYLFGGKGEIITVFGAFTSAFWVVSLGFAFLIWSPRVRKNIPVIEIGSNIANAGAGICPQCGGGISYRADDLATVCGYCGVEVYRAKLAWKLRNVTNSADRKAEFSLIDARKAAENAVDEVIGTPKVFMLLLILIAIFVGVSWLISAGYDMLPEGVRSFLEFVGDLIDIFA